MLQATQALCINANSLTSELQYWLFHMNEQAFQAVYLMMSVTKLNHAHADFPLP